MLVSVFDVGGNHISTAIYNTATASLVNEISCRHFKETDADGPLDILTSLATQATEHSMRMVDGLSIAAPSPFDYANGISQMQHKLHQLYGVDLKHVLAEKTHLPPASIVFLNDADAFLFGALESSPSSRLRSIGIVLGTGIGSGFAVDGEVVTSGADISPGGEIWNLPFEQTTVEGAISTSSIVGAYARRTGVTVTVKAIAAAARKSDADARDTFSHFGLQLAKVLEQIDRAFSPEQIFLGGGIVGAADLFLPVVQRTLDRPERIMVIQNTSAAPLIGAGLAWKKAMSGDSSA